MYENGRTLILYIIRGNMEFVKKNSTENPSANARNTAKNDIYRGIFAAIRRMDIHETEKNRAKQYDCTVKIAKIS